MIYAMLKEWLLVLAYFGPMYLAESVRRRGDPMPWGTRINAVLFLMLYVAAAVVFFAFINPIRAWLNITPIIPLSGIWGLIAALVIGDFLYYWMHRAQHAIPALWRFHRVHHSIEHMGAGTGYHHVSQIAIEYLFIALPVAFLVGRNGALLVTVILSFHGFYLHSTIDAHFGRLGRWIADNRGHRIHHGIEPRHHDKNFGVPSLIWDRLFGTAYFPADDEWPDVGLSEQCEASTVVEWLTAEHQPRATTSATA